MIHHIAEFGRPSTPNSRGIGIEADVKASTITAKVPDCIAASAFEFGRKSFVALFSIFSRFSVEGEIISIGINLRRCNYAGKEQGCD